MEKQIIPTYKKEAETSYTTGAFASLELLHTRPHLVRRVFVHPEYTQQAALLALCAQHQIPAITHTASFRRLGSTKGSALVLAECAKFEDVLEPQAHHIVLVNPADMGNLGTILRTMAGFGFLDVAIITPACDVFHPKALRAAQGALFHLRTARFSSYEAYAKAAGPRQAYPFLLTASQDIRHAKPPQDKPFSLVFGNESTGLPPAFAAIGQPLRIPQTPLVDSLNLAVAAGVAGYTFACSAGLL